MYVDIHVYTLYAYLGTGVSTKLWNNNYASTSGINVVCCIMVWYDSVGVVLLLTLLLLSELVCC